MHVSCLGDIFDGVQVEAGDETDRKKQVMAFFNQNAIHLNEEGLVIKDLRGHYMARVYCSTSASSVQSDRRYTLV